MFRSITWRVAAAFIVLVVVTIGALSAYLSQFIRGDYLDELETQLGNQARLVADTVAPDLMAEPGGIDSLCRRLGEWIDARVTIVGRDGSVLGDSNEDSSTMENHAGRPEVDRALSLELGSSVRHSATLGYDMMYVAVPIVWNEGLVGVARVSVALSQIEDLLGQVNRRIAAAAAIAAAVAVFLAFQVSRITVEPLKQLTTMSRRMAEGDLDQEILVPSNDEVGELAAAFNRMAARIRETVVAISGERDKVSVIVSQIGDAIFVTDGQARVTMLNRAAEAVARLPRHEAPGRTFIEVVRDHELDELVQRCLQSGEQQTGLVETRPRRGLLRVVATPLVESAGCLVLVQDLTELRKLETVRRDFVSNISHELRTPIASLKALGETLQDGAIDDATVSREFLERLNVEVDKLAQMVEELGELSRIESGEVRLEREPIDVRDTAARAADRLGVQAERAGLRLLTDFPADLPTVAADARRIEQSIVNLIHNSIKFTPAGGQVVVSARQEDDGVVVSVSDTGTGIPADDLPRVFERFYKVDKARSQSGTGLGLAIVKHLVEAHGGRIWADSVEGRGATFSFSLPLA